MALLTAGLLLVLRSSENEYGTYLYQAGVLAGKSERTAAVAAYREAARLRPHDPHPHLELARVYLGWGRCDEALSAISDAERLGAEAASVERLRVLVHAQSAESAKTEKLSHWEAVVEHAGRVLDLEPDDRETERALARAHLGLREWDAACALYADLIRSDPQDSTLRERLGALLLGDDPAALKHLAIAATDLSDQLLTGFLESTDVDDSAYVHARLGRILIEHQEWALAARHLERGVQLRPDYAEAQAHLGHALDRMGYRDEARAHLLEATELAPTAPLGHTFLGLHYERWDDTAAARDAYETAYDLAPDNAAICTEIGQTWAAEGRYGAAEIWLKEAVSLEPGDPALWEALAWFYLNHNIASNDRAIEATERLLELAPDSALAHDLRGWAAFQSGLYEGAEPYLQRAIELDAESASAYYHLGLLRKVQGQTGEAERAFRRAMDLDTTGDLASLIERVY